MKYKFNKSFNKLLLMKCIKHFTYYKFHISSKIKFNYIKKCFENIL